jgi:hypothetical protein
MKITEDTNGYMLNNIKHAWLTPLEKEVEFIENKATETSLIL